MNLNGLQQTLIAAARAHPPGDAVPYAFEQRILARLSDRPMADSSLAWVRGLWRAAASCAAVCLLLGAWTLFSPSGDGADDEFVQQLENTVFAAVDQEGDSTW